MTIHGTHGTQFSLNADDLERLLDQLDPVKHQLKSPSGDEPAGG